MSIETLLIKQAQLSDLRRRLKAEGVAESDKCERQRREVKSLGFVNGENCIGSVYQGWRDDCHDGPYCELSFEELWDDAIHEGDVCQHCQNVRALKKQRMQAGRELGGVRAAITRVGRRLAKEQVS